MQGGGQESPKPERVTLRPQPGPQMRHAACRADICVFGGAAGGGKSWALAVELMRWVMNGRFRGVLFRRTYPEIEGAGSIWEEVLGMAEPFKPKVDYGDHTLTFPSGATIEFHHLQHVKHADFHKSKQYTLECFDELTTFEEEQFWKVYSRNRSMAGIRPYTRCGTNPDPDSWVRKFIDWWIDERGFPIPERDGVLRWFVRDGDELVWADSIEELRKRFAHWPKVKPKSATFIASKLSDNRILTDADPDYEANLLAMPKIQREQLLEGNWNARAISGEIFERSWFEVVDRPPAKRRSLCRAWDKAGTKPSPQNPDPDWTVGLKYSRGDDGLFYIEDVILMRDRPMAVDHRIVSTAQQDGKACIVGLWQDPGQAGKKDVEHMQQILSGYRTHVERASQNKVLYAGPVSSQAEARNIKVVRGPWLDRVLSQLEAFPLPGIHDDVVDALSLAHIIIGDEAGAWIKRMNKWRSDK